MKACHKLSLLFLMLMLSCCTRPTVKTLTICCTTDVHAQYEEGMGRVATCLKTIRAERENVIYIDNGDFLQGDIAAVYYNSHPGNRPHYGVVALKALGADAVVVGNHDIEAGPDIYSAVRDDLQPVPFLAANTPRDDNGESYFQRYAIIEKGGVKVAVIGFTNPKCPSWLPKDLFPDFSFEKIEDIAQSIVDEVISLHSPDIVVVSAHSGLGRRSEKGSGDETDENVAIYLSENLRNVDLVICGHDHQEELTENANGEGLCLVDAGTRGHCVGRIDFELDYKGSNLKSKKIISCALDRVENLEHDSTFLSLTEDCRKAVQEYQDEPVCSITETINTSEALSGPSYSTNLMHDVQFALTGADISITAPLGEKVIPAGKICRRDLVNLYKYENDLYVVSMTGSQIKDYLEYSYDGWLNRNTPTFNYDSAKGIRYRVYRNRPKGSRIDILSMENGSPFDINATYKVAMNSYRASGGGDILVKGAGIDPMAEGFILEKKGSVRLALIDYLKRQGNYHPRKESNWYFTD